MDDVVRGQRREAVAIRRASHQPDQQWEVTFLAQSNSDTSAFPAVGPGAEFATKSTPDIGKVLGEVYPYRAP